MRKVVGGCELTAGHEELGEPRHGQLIPTGEQHRHKLLPQLPLKHQQRVLPQTGPEILRCQGRTAVGVEEAEDATDAVVGAEPAWEEFEASFQLLGDQLEAVRHADVACASSETKR